MKSITLIFNTNARTAVADTDIIRTRDMYLSAAEEVEDSYFTITNMLLATAFNVAKKQGLYTGSLFLQVDNGEPIEIDDEGRFTGYLPQPCLVYQDLLLELL